MTVDEAARVQPQYSPRCGKYRALAFCSYPAENAAELRVLETPADGGEPLIRIERVFFGTLEDTVGSEHRAPQLTSSRISVDNRLFASGVGRARRYDQPESEGFFSASNVEPISSDGRVSTSLDSACATPPSAPVDALAEAMTLAEEPCVNALVAVDPGFGEELCYRDGISSQAHCGPDGELRSEVLPGPLGCTCGTSGGQAAALAMFTLLLRFRFRPARRA